MMDKFVVDGASSFKSSVTITISTMQSASLWASTSTVTPHLYVSTTGNVGIGTAVPAYKVDIPVGDLNVGGVFRKAGTPGTALTCAAEEVIKGGVVSGGILTAGSCATGVAGGTESCAGDSVQVGDICVDKYEGAIYDAASGGNQKGVSSDDYTGCDDNGQNCTGVYARSVSGVTPSAYMTWFQASAACRNVGKRLLTNAEWTEAARGTPDPGALAQDNGPQCNTSGTRAMQTGLGTSCRSTADAENMIGSLWEWVADWGTAGAGASNAMGTAAPWPAGYNGDQAWNIGGNAHDGTAWQAGAVPAVLRGGYWGHGASAGVFAFSAYNGPSNWYDSVGFRCGRTLKSGIWQSGISDVVADLTPQLGGDLDVNGHKIISVSNGNIVIEPSGTGSVYVNGKSTFTSNVLISSNVYVVGVSSFTDKVYISGGSTGQLLKKNSGGYLEWGDASGAGDNLGNHVATATLNMAGFGVVNVGSMTIVATTTYTSSLWVSTSAVTPHLYVSTMGNVGIGTAAPEARLDVRGSNTQAYSLAVGTSAAYSMVVSTGGKVGIGTMNPTEQLEVMAPGNKKFQVRSGPAYISIMIEGVEAAKITP